MADVQFDISLKNTGSGTEGLTLFAPVDLNSQRSNKYSLSTPYKTSYAANSLFTVVLSSGTINYVSPNYDITPDELAAGLTAQGAGEWSVYQSDAVNGNVFYVLTASEIISFDVSGIPMWVTKKTSSLGSGLKIQMIDVLIGYAISHTTLFKTTDAGENWVEVNTTLSGTLTSMFFVNENIGWVVSQTILYKTIDGGENFSTQTTNGSGLFDIFFITENFGWIASINLGGPKYQMFTTDGGVNWQDDITGGLNRNCLSVYFLDSLRGWMVGQDGIIRRTTNGGSTWSNVTSAITTSINTVFFINENIGWLGTEVGGNLRLMKSIDGGAVWSQQTSIPDISGAITDIFFLNENIGFACANNAMLFKTIDGGVNWEDISSSIPGIIKGIESIYFFNEELGFLCGWSASSSFIICKLSI